MKFTDLITDPVLVRADFRCEYCGVDLLSDFSLLFSYVRDHIVPRSRGGADASDNRAASCAACDRLKGGANVPDMETAKRVIAARRHRRLEWFDRVREAIRG